MKDRRLYTLLTANIFSSVGSGITMIGVPWLLVNREGGEQLFGYAALAMTLLLFFLSPYIGVLIDRVSRKKMLLWSEVAGFSIVAFFAAWGHFRESYETWQLIAIYMGGSLYYTIHFPTQFAFNQEIFDRSQYQSLNSVMEIQNQTASMVAGGLSSLLIEKVNLSYLLWLDASTYIIGFILLSTIPYVPSNDLARQKKVTIWSNMKEGFLYLKDKPLFFLFFVCALMPFIGVMVGNYLFPVFIAKTLQADATVMGLSDMIYAIGAVLAGLSLPYIITRIGSYKAVTITVAVFAMGIMTAAWVPLVWLFLVVKMFLGWGNAGARVARNTLLMETVPNSMMGRVNSFFNAVGMGFRVSLIGLFSQTISYTGASISLSIMGLLLFGALIGVFASRSAFVSTPKPSTSMG